MKKLFTLIQGKEKNRSKEQGLVNRKKTMEAIGLSILAIIT